MGFPIRHWRACLLNNESAALTWQSHIQGVLTATVLQVTPCLAQLSHILPSRQQIQDSKHAAQPGVSSTDCTKLTATMPS